MPINIPERWRGWLYIIFGLGGLVVTYLVTKDLIGDPEVALWTGVAGFVSLLARFNLGPSPLDDKVANKP